jgi:hypothetical protein
MTNEEIYKYADKALKNEEKKYNSVVLGTAILFIIGLGLIYVPLGLSDIPYTRWLAVIVCGFPYLVYLAKNSDRYFKMRREFIYNLVRQDERNRCMTKMERYEGSK